MSYHAPITPQCRTLIVEDDADSCEATQKILSRHGYAVECSASVADALAKLKDGPCCLIVDLMLPDGTGNEIIREARLNYPSIPVAIVTAAGSSPIAADAVLLRPDAFFIKPLDYTELLAWLASASRAARPLELGGDGATVSA
jgi:DNA-binding response OmpR family regulator